MWRAQRRILGAIAVLTAIGCGDDDGNGPAGSISLTASPSALTLDPGGTGNITVTLVRGGGFANPVNVTVEGLPTGITATVTPAQLTGQTTQATVAVTVASTVAAGSYPATVRASATGVGAATAQYTVNVNALPSYTLTLNPTGFIVPPGGNQNTTVTIARTNFSGAVTLSLEGAPTGVTATFNPASPTTANSTVATINVANTVANGGYNLTIKGVAAGQPDKTAALALTVAPTPDFTISANPTTVPVAPGGSGNTNVTIVRTGLTADIALTLVNPPAGITGTFTPPTLTGGTLTSTLTINVGAGVTTGSYNVTVQGTTGALTKTTVVAVNVAAAGANIVWDFCGPIPVPTKFWRLSAGTWAEVPPTVVGNVTRYTFTIAAGSGGVSYTFSLGGATANTTFYAQSTELSGGAQTCPPAPTTVAKTFNVTGMGGTEIGLLGYGGVTANLSSTTPSYNVNVVQGTYDWLALWGQPSQAFTHYNVGRAEAAPGSAVAINRATATALVQFPFTVTGGAAGALYQFIQSLSGARGSISTFVLGTPAQQTAGATAHFLAAPDRQGSDMNTLSISSTEATGSSVVSVRQSTLFVGSGPPASSQFPLPAAVPAFAVTAQTGAPYPSWTVAGTTPADYQTTTGTISATVTSTGALSTITATRAWLQANQQATSYSLSTPILPNYTASWAPAAPLGSAAVSMTSATLSGAPVAGTAIHTAQRLQTPP